MEKQSYSAMNFSLRTKRRRVVNRRAQVFYTGEPAVPIEYEVG